MKKVLISIFFISLLMGCSTSNTNESEENTSTLDEKTEPKIDANTSFRLPSPVELFILIKSEGANFVQEELHKADKAGDYLDKEKKAINFGIYAADLAYCTVFEKQQETHTYFKTLKKMADGLGINDGYDTEILDRIDNNLNNSDSLYQITNDSYWEVCTYLEENGKSDVLSEILLGGWIESVFLSVNSVIKYEDESPIVLRITEQSFLLENLIEYMRTLKNNNVSEIYLKQLIDLQYSFDKLIDNPDGVNITKEQYKEIADKIKAIRMELIG
ncbi:MAG: hypothetical protein IPO21_16990 [Bacteroidales bacterium]|nr:hypothetical protein [Bacteroidales bacterium]